MFNKISQRYRKQEFYAKIEPDNYASQYLFEKLRGVPEGLVKDLEAIEDFGEEKDKISEKIAEMKSKLLDKMELMKTLNLDENRRAK